MTWTAQPTDDGSFTFFSAEFNEAFHSRQGARSEAFTKFAEATDLPEQARAPQLCLLDVCYGLGYNSAAALETIWAVNPDCRVELYALELDASVPQAVVDSSLVNIWLPPTQEILQALATDSECHSQQLSAKLLVGDARQTIQQLSMQADAVFFDPFSPRRCPQLWTVEFFQQVRGRLAPNGKLATYSRSASVRAAMQQVGLQIGTIPLGAAHLPHEWSQGTVAAIPSAASEAIRLTPLSPMEQEHLQTRAAVPYRDLSLRDSAQQILARHQAEQQQSSLESTSSWRRRWGIR
ncbi:MAG: hypothetical protein KME07_13665 [Pegethrix bostrychoides GSE-TBD4-15B]|jgi:tRNA U34 5-methylaminomethyl-2-thiouridine-forming methyltransferase MnmC|uniref:MnmC-like methyltransferase domain-containing protein n=1 Tax=Pegethrix bostrychoides GSE-TBD4-15B TaxID=2839662 RepID=A0A951PBX2_9CYAN|nr:hypothetical protein [Pegethrix bostrychoides GSE-TBD4-15B]